MQKRLALFTPTTDLNALEGRRHRDRGGVRGNADQEGAVRQDREDRQARRGARDQHLLSRRRRDRGRDQPRARRARHALLLARQRDEAPGDRARQGHGAGRARDRDGGRAQDQQGAGGGRRLPRLRRQPHAVGARHRGGETAARRRAAAGRRRRAHRVRLPDGAVRDERPRRHRRRLALAQGARRAQRDRRQLWPNRAASARRPARASISTRAARRGPIRRSRS